MIVDTSAVVAVLSRESDAARYAEALAATTSFMSAATYVECGAVIDRRSSVDLAERFDRWLADARITVVALSAAQSVTTRNAYRVYGRGSGHRAGLNFGDCFAYALAIDRDMPLLWKGDDFTHTDVRSALAELGL